MKSFKDGQVKSIKAIQNPIPKPKSEPQTHQKSFEKPIKPVQTVQKVDNPVIQEVPQTQIRTQEYHFDRLTPTQFYCQYYQLIKEVADNVLTVKYGSRLLKSLQDSNERKKIEQESTADVRSYLVSRGITPERDEDMKEYIRVVFSEILGFGILEYLLNDKNVDEIIVQRHDYIQAEIKGIITDTEYKFPSYEAALGVTRKIIQPLNKTLDYANPNVDGYLPDGSRLSASIPPLKADNDISLNIRKFSNKVYPLSYYAENFQSSTSEMIKFIEMCVSAKKNMIISGGTGSGKTTAENSMSFAMGEDERIITIEDTPELKIPKKRVEPYLVVHSNSEGSKGISIRDIIIHALRKRPDRLVVGECRGGEIFEFLNAANTGHEGSITSIHANSPSLAFERMENMMLQNDETKNMTHDAILQTLSSSVQLIIQVSRLDDGSRKITQVTEVLGYGRVGYDKLRRFKQIKETVPCNDNMVYLRDIFKFKETSTEIKDGKRIVHGRFIATGYIPTFLHTFKMKGYDIDESFFEKRTLLEV